MLAIAGEAVPFVGWKVSQTQWMHSDFCRPGVGHNNKTFRSVLVFFFLCVFFFFCKISTRMVTRRLHPQKGFAKQPARGNWLKKETAKNVAESTFSWLLCRGTSQLFQCEGRGDNERVQRISRHWIRIISLECHWKTCLPYWCWHALRVSWYHQESHPQTRNEASVCSANIDVPIGDMISQNLPERFSSAWCVWKRYFWRNEKAFLACSVWKETKASIFFHKSEKTHFGQKKEFTALGSFDGYKCAFKQHVTGEICLVFSHFFNPSLLIVFRSWKLPVFSRLKCKPKFAGAVMRMCAWQRSKLEVRLG